MAGTITYPEDKIRGIGVSPSYTYRCTLTMDGSGNMADVPVAIGAGYLVAINTIPSTDNPPTAAYNLQLHDEYGVDILVGEGAGRSATVAERINLTPAIVRGSITPVIDGAGDGAEIDLIVWLQGL